MAKEIAIYRKNSVLFIGMAVLLGSRTIFAQASRLMLQTAMFAAFSGK